MIFAQNLAGLVAPALPEWAARFLYFGGVFTLGAGGPAVAVLYSIVPWIGVMAAGYAFGAVMIREPEERDRICLRIGLAATALFLVVGGIGVLVQPAGPGAPPALFRLLNQQKYPASQLFLLMTLGPTIALLPQASLRSHTSPGASAWQAREIRGRIGDVLAVFGRVPLFYYLLHIPLIHAAALVVSLAREGRVNPWLFGNHPMMPPPVPNGYRWSLPLLYLVFAVVVAILYVACRWFAQWKARRQGASHVKELSSAGPQPRTAQQL